MSLLKKIGIASTAIAVLLAAAPVFAQGRPTTVPGGIKSVKKTAESSVPKVRAEERVKTVRDEAKTRVENKRVEVEQHLAKVKDAAKQRLAKQIIEQLSHLNTVWTDHFAKLLDRYDAVLQKIKDRAQTAAAKGKEVTAVNSAIQAAETALTTARAAVEAQAAKTYTLNTGTAPADTTSSEGQRQLIKNMQASFKALRETLRTDLSALRDGPMKSAREAVHDALKSLRTIPGVDEGDTAPAPATTTSSPTNQ